ncbi:MAG: VWA domain-containing protein [Pseudomonadota bacterium]
MCRNYLGLSSIITTLFVAGACIPDEQAAHRQTKSNPPTVEETASAQRSKSAPVGQANQETFARERLLNIAPQDVESPHRFADLAIAPLDQSVLAVTRDAQVMPALPMQPLGRDRYEDVDPNPIKLVSRDPVSTFSIDVDTASYANLRRFLNEGTRPPVNAVRVEELINYFDYDYQKPADIDQPFATHIALFEAPWDADKQLLRIGLKGYEIRDVERPKANLVFLVDTSGSMASADKLPLLKRSLRLLIEEMREDDSIAIIAYAGSAGIVLEPTAGVDKRDIIRAIERFSAGGGTAGAAGIREAYRLAEANFDENAVNRVILATDGDFNVGISDPDRLEDFIATKRESDVYLSILGFGRGNLNDMLMQRLAQAGNGNASYIDGLMEARKVLVDEMSSLLFPIADDVKIQIEFNPKRVAEYRLIGYETRMLKQEEFNNDRVDAGEIGSGHTVTALYEITSPDSPSRLVDDLRYGVQPASATDAGDNVDEVAWFRLRYKRPGDDQSQLIERPVPATSATPFDQAPAEARFATAVAGFGEVLRQSVHMGTFDLDAVLGIASASRGDDPFGYRSEFLQLVRLAKSATLVDAGDG